MTVNEMKQTIMQLTIHGIFMLKIIDWQQMRTQRNLTVENKDEHTGDINEEDVDNFWKNEKEGTEQRESELSEDLKLKMIT
jgi:hypothetical protein